MSVRYLQQPFRLASRGGVATTQDIDRHLSDLIMAALFTAPGERVNAPAFGVGLNRLVFEVIDPMVLSQFEFRIDQGLRTSLDDQLEFEQIELSVEDDPAGERERLVLRIRHRWLGPGGRGGDRRSRALEVTL